MSLEQLKATFQTQMNLDGYITVDAATLVNDANLNVIPEFNTLLKNYLLLKTPPLTVVALPISDPVDNTLTVIGTATIINLENVTVTLVFTIDADDITQLLLTTALTSTWKFTDSFPLMPTYPANALLFNFPTYLFTTQVKQTYNWQKQDIELLQGLNFSSYLLFQGPLVDVPLFISSEQNQVLFSGPIDCSTMGAPTYSIYPKLGLIGNILGTASVPGFTVTNPRIFFTIDSVDKLIDPDDIEGKKYKAYKVYVYFTVDLQIGEGESAILCEFRAPLLQKSNNYTYSLIPAPYEDVTIDSIIDLLGGANFMESIPQFIQGCFLKSIVLKGFSAGFYIPSGSTSVPSVSSLSAAIGTNEPWEIGIFTVEEITLRYSLLFSYSNVMQKTTTNTLAYFDARFQFYTELFPGYFQVQMLQEDVNELTLSASYAGEVSLDDIIRVMSGGDLSVPEQLVNVTFSDFGVSFNSDSDGSTYSFEGQAETDFEIEVLSTKLTMNLQVNVDWLADKTPVYTLNGGLTLGDSYFTLSLNFDRDQEKLIATWEGLDGETLGFNDLCHTLNLEMFAVPEGIDLALESAGLTYDFKNKTMTIQASSARYGEVLYMSQNVAPEGQTAQWEYVFIFQFNTTGLTIDSLPLFGKLPDGQQISLDVLQISGASYVITQAEMAKWTALIPPPVTDDQEPFILPPSIDYPGASITAKTHLGSATLELFLPLSTGENPKPDEQVLLQSANQSMSTRSEQALMTLGAEDTTTTPMNALTIWLKVQNTLGPIYLNRIGFAFQGERFCILLDASVLLTSMSMDVFGMGVSVDLEKLDQPETYQFVIQGLGISFQQPPLQVTGALLRVPPSGEEDMAFDGQLILAMPDLKIVGLGAYSTLKDTNDSSMFVIAMLNKPLGGTPFFYVTGIAAGFGYNRALKIPVQSNVQDFPLVKGLSTPSAIGGTNPSPNQALATLVDWTPAVQGQYWFAIGVQGTTFEIINTNALFVVQFGKDTIISIIGVSTLKQPQQGTTFAYAALDVIGNFLPDEGEVMITGGLAPGAYILTRDAKLKGGFAFASWFGKNPHAGDFVFTIGGYHPDFPLENYPHYPIVSPVGVDWKISAGMAFTGSAYFAITPSMMMAGTNLQWSYSAGGLKAWLKVRSDILLYWKPFYFLADIAVSVGVSLRMKVAFVTITVSAEVSSTCHLWGPEMGGSVYVDWCILAFTIGFGAKKRVPPNNITWDEFQGMLPSKTMDPAAGNLSATATTEPTKQVYLHIDVNQGLMNSQTLADLDLWLVNAEQFKVSVDSAIPATQATITGADSDYIVPGKSVGMCRVEGGVTPENYQCEQSITLLKIEEDSIDAIWTCMITNPNYDPTVCAENSATVPVKGWEFNAIEQNVPTALWSNKQSNSLDDAKKQMVTAVTGVMMNPVAPTYDNGTPPMEIEQVFAFQVINEENTDRLSIDPSEPPTVITASSGDSFTEIKQINDAATTTARTQVYDVLVALGIEGLANGSLTNMAADPGKDFVDEPWLETTASGYSSQAPAKKCKCKIIVMLSKLFHKKP